MGSAEWWSVLLSGGIGSGHPGGQQCDAGNDSRDGGARKRLARGVTGFFRRWV
jgi:hypothetical protein